LFLLCSRPNPKLTGLDVMADQQQEDTGNRTPGGAMGSGAGAIAAAGVDVVGEVLSVFSPEKFLESSMLAMKGSHPLLEGVALAEKIDPKSIRGMALALVGTLPFFVLSHIFIFGNAINMGFYADRDNYSKEMGDFFGTLETVFLVLFVAELVIQAIALRCYLFRSKWLVMDLVVVVVEVVTQWLVPLFFEESSVQSFTVLRVLRVLRAGRAVRVMVQHRQLRVLVYGMLQAGPIVFWASTLLISVLYLFGIFGVEVVKSLEFTASDTDVAGLEFLREEHFGNLARTMLSLAQITTGDSWTSIVRPLVYARPLLILYFGLFLIVTMVVVMNLMTAVLVETAIEAGQNDAKEQQALAVRQMQDTLQQVKVLMADTDTDGSGDISKDELIAAYNADPVIRAKMDSVVNLQDVLLLFELFDSDGNGVLTMQEFTSNLSDFKTDPIKCILTRLANHFHHFERSFWRHHRRDQTPTASINPGSTKDFSPGQIHTQPTFQLDDVVASKDKPVVGKQSIGIQADAGIDNVLPVPEELIPIAMSIEFGGSAANESPEPPEVPDRFQLQPSLDQLTVLLQSPSPDLPQHMVDLLSKVATNATTYQTKAQENLLRLQREVAEADAEVRRIQIERLGAEMLVDSGKRIYEANGDSRSMMPVLAAVKRMQTTFTNGMPATESVTLATTRAPQTGLACGGCLIQREMEA